MHSGFSSTAQGNLLMVLRYLQIGAITQGASDWVIRSKMIAKTEC